MKYSSVILLVVFFTLLSSSIQAKENELLRNSGESIVETWISGKYDSTSKVEVLSLAEKALQNELPYLAEQFLAKLTPDPQDSNRLYLEFLIATQKRDIINAQKLTKQLVTALATEKQIDQNIWENRLVKIWQWHREKNLIDQGKLIFDQQFSQFNQWPLLASEHLLWCSFFEPETQIRKETLERLEDCKDFNSCNAPIKILNSLNSPVVARYWLLNSWQMATTKAQLLATLNTAILIGDNISSRKILDNILDKTLSLEDFRQLFLLMPQYQQTIINRLKEIPIENDEQKIRLISLLWQLKEYKHVKSMLPQHKNEESDNKEKASADINESPKDKIKTVAKIPTRQKEESFFPTTLEAFKLLQNISSSNVFSKQKSYYKTLSDQLLEKLLTTKQTEEDKRLLLYSVKISPVKVELKQQLLKNIETNITEQSLEQKLLSLKLNMATGRTNKAAIDYSAISSSHPDDVSLVWEILKHYKNRKYFKNSMNIEQQWIGSMKAASASKNINRVYQSAPILRGMKKRKEAQQLAVSAINLPMKTLEKIELAMIVSDVYRSKSFSDFAKSIDRNNIIDELLLLISLYFKMDMHEQALEVFHLLEQNKSLSTPLYLASRLANNYVQYKAAIKHMKRRTRISLDIYTNLIVRLLRKHIETSKIKYWTESFALLQKLQSEIAIENHTAERRLRKAMWETNEDIDACIFEFLSIFQSNKDQPYEELISVATILAKNQNPDFFSVLWQRIKLLENEQNIFSMQDSTMQVLLSSFLSHKREECKNDFLRLCDRWKQLLLKQNDADKYMVAAYSLSAMYNYQKDSFETENNFFNSSQNAIKRTVDDIKKELDKIADKETLSSRRARIVMEEDPETHDFSASTIHQQTIQNAWFFSDCLAYSVKIKEDYKATAEITVDSNGMVAKVTLRSFPAGLNSEKECLTKRLKGFVFTNIEPPFGFGKLQIHSFATEPNGITDADREFKKGKLEQLKDKLVAAQDKFEQTEEDRADFLEDIADNAKNNLRQAVRRSYDEEVYQSAAWWYKNFLDDKASSIRLTNERRWIIVSPYVGAAISIFIFVSLLLWYRKKKRSDN